jgi:hypothetical protein
MFKSSAYIIVMLVTFVSPSYAWEESDKQAFEEKIELISALVVQQSKSINTKEDVRTQCLLQSTGIDVVTRYLQLNPNDKPWRAKYLKLRDSLTVCLGVMYKMNKLP